MLSLNRYLCHFYLRYLIEKRGFLRVIHVTCEQCQTVYKVEERLLGAAGRTVRCMQCHYMWHQDAPIVEEPPAETPPAEPAATPEWMEDENKGELDFRSTVKGQYFHEDDMQIPQAVKPKVDDAPPQPFQIPVMTYRPIGMGAGQFGICVFMLLSCLSLSVMFLAKGPILQQAPQMASLYKLLGFDLKVPGEGLALSDMTAEGHVANGNRSLAVAAKLANISAAGIAYPVLEVRLKGPYGSTLKTWNFTPDKKPDLAAGDAVPLSLTFDDAPAEGKTVELKVIEP